MAVEAAAAEPVVPAPQVGDDPLAAQDRTGLTYQQREQVELRRREVHGLAVDGAPAGALVEGEPGVVGDRLVGATQLGAMAAVSRFAPDGARGRAQGTLSAVNASISVGATLVSGLAYRADGPLAFLLMVPLAAAGLGLALASRRAGVRPDTNRQP